MQSGFSQIAFVLILLLLKIIGAFICSAKARELNRSEGWWGYNGFMLPLVASIWIFCLKPNTEKK
jgi:hypothetical protein